MAPPKPVIARNPATTGSDSQPSRALPGAPSSTPSSTPSKTSDRVSNATPVMPSPRNQTMRAVPPARR
ncbi:hypothetical protein [Streptomyces tibetensis]|uniref:hypothetical protein n=1 Tax=Streptomyces tibetensis TaxID=2382123 RepID=UPI0033C344A0